MLAPRLLRSALLEDIPKTLGVTPTVGDIRVNPFLLRLEVGEFALAAPNGEKLLAFRRLFVEFELWFSIWHRAYSFANIDIDAPTVNAVVDRDGRLNLVDLSPKVAPAKTQEKKAPLPNIRIGSFKVSNGLATYEDRSRPSEFAARLEPINFELASFTTGVEGGRFTFTGISKLGERVEWHGHVSVQPIESDGEFQIDGLRAHTIWEYLEDRLNFVVNTGTIDLNATYKFSLQNAVDLQATVSRIQVRDLAVRPKQSEVDWISVPSLLLSGTTVDLLRRQAHSDSLTLTGVKVVTWLEPDGSLNLLKLAQPPASNAPAAPAQSATNAATNAAAAPPANAAAPAPAPAMAPAAPWKFDLREFALREADISADDRSTTPAASALAPFSLKADGASLDLAKPVTVSLETRINDSGSLSVTGTSRRNPCRPVWR